MESIYKNAFEEKNPFPGWTLTQQISGSDGEELWIAENGEEETKGLVRIIHIPAYTEEYNNLIANGVVRQEVDEKLKTDTESCIYNAANLIDVDKGHILPLRMVYTDLLEDGVPLDGKCEALVILLYDYYPTFSAFYTDKKVNKATLLSLGCDICDAITEYSATGFCHTNVQLENVFVAENGKCMLGMIRFPVILDSMLTNPNDNKILRFIAPEIANGEEYDVRADIYSLGMTLYFKFNGNKLPFVEGEKGSISRQQMNEAIIRRLDGDAFPPPSKAQDALGDIILRACAYNPDDRYETSSDFKKAIIAYANENGIKVQAYKDELNAEKDSKLRESVTAGENTDESDVVFEKLEIHDNNNLSDETDDISFSKLLEAEKSFKEKNGIKVSYNDERMNLSENVQHGVFADSDETDMQSEENGEQEKQKENIKAAPEIGYFDDRGEFVENEISDETNTEGISDNGNKKNGKNKKPEKNVEHKKTNKSGNANKNDSKAEYDDDEENRKLSPLHIILISVGIVAVIAICLLFMAKCSGNVVLQNGNDKPEDTTTRVEDTTPTPVSTDIKIPNIVGMKENEALKELAKAGYTGEAIITGIYSDTIESGLIISQTPTADSMIKSDGMVKYTVSLGTAPSWTPDVSKLSADDAKGRLEALEYNVKLVYAYSDKVAEGKIIKQSINPGVEVPKNTEIVIVVSQGKPGDDYKAVESLSLSSTVLVMVPEQTNQLEVTVAPDDASSKDVWWTTDNPEIATVDSNGNVTAVAIGSTSITVTSVEGEFKAICKVTVQKDVVPVTEIGFKVDTVELKIGDTDRHTPYVRPTDASNKYVIFYSEDPNIVTVDEYGAIEAVGVGSAKVYARASDGGFVAYYTVNVTLVDGYSQVPNLVGMNVSDAETKLQYSGLTCRKIYVKSTTDAKGKVIAQDLEAKSLVNEGSLVTITVSNGDSEWSDWMPELPSDVTASDKTESKTEWSYRKKSENTYTNNIPSGWTVNEAKTTYGEWSSLGEWSTTPATASDTVNVESKTQWRVRNREIISWSDFGEWTTTEAVESAGCRVENKVMYRWRTESTTTALTDKLEGWKLISHSPISSFCEWTIEMPPSSVPQSDIETRTNGGITEYRWKVNTDVYYFVKYGEWSEWSEERPVGNDIDLETAIFYRSSTANYGFGDWSEWSDSEISASGENDVESRKVYRTSTRDVIYVCYKWSIWSQWQDTEVKANENVEVRSQMMYRYVIVK